MAFDGKLDGHCLLHVAECEFYNIPLQRVGFLLAGNEVSLVTFGGLFWRLGPGPGSRFCRARSAPSSGGALSGPSDRRVSSEFASLRVVET